MRKTYIKYLSIIFTFLFVFSMLGQFMEAPTVAASTSNDQAKNKKISVAKLFIARVSDKINSFLSLAKNYNINISEVAGNVSKAEELLSNASQHVEDNPIYAIKLAINASVTFGPVARYIIQNLPQGAIANIRSESLKHAVEVKLNMLEKLEAYIQRLNNMGISVPLEANETLSEANSTLQNALSMLNTTAYNTSEVAHMVANASKLIGKANMLLYKRTSKAWVYTTFADKSLHLMVIASVNIEHVLNKTVDVLNETGNVYEAEEKLSITINITDRLIMYIDKAINISIDRSGPESNFTKTLEILKEGFSESKSNMTAAYNALVENNDTISAVSYLENAANVIQQTLEDVVPLFKRANHYLNIVHDVLGKMRFYIRNNFIIIAMHHKMKLTTSLRMIEIRLRISYNLYKKGKITARQLNNTLTIAESTLNHILSALKKSPNPPKDVIKEINDILRWISEVRAEIST